MLVLRVQQIPNVIQEVTPVLGGATLNRAFQRALRCGVVTEVTAATLRRRRRNVVKLWLQEGECSNKHYQRSTIG